MAQLIDEIVFQSGVKLKNRIVMAPMTIQSAFFDGGVTQEMITYYAARSGDAGAIIVESAFVENYGRAFQGALGIDTDSKIAGLKKLAEAIKAKGSKAILQIYHAGRMANPEYNGGHKPISASPVAALRDNAEIPLEMTAAHIDDMIESFGNAVNRAILAGFDGVEIHGANTYLIQQFFSPHSNRRNDKWGGDLDKRTAFPLAILNKTKQVAASHDRADFIIGYRFSPEEIEQPGIRFDDTLYLLDKLATHGLDYFHFSMGSWARNSIVTPEDTELLIAKYRQLQSDNVAKVPVIGVGGIAQREDAEHALAQGYDMVSIGKGYLVEPTWAHKALNNETCAEFADIAQQHALQIPTPLWEIMDYMIVDSEAEAIKHQRIKELQSIDIKFDSGEYTAYGRGHNGHLPVTVTFSEDRILNIVVDSSKESDGIANPAFERIPQQILDGQTLNIDVISGATVSSQAVIDGVSNAVDLAGGNSEALRCKAREVVEWASKTIEETVDIVVVGGGGAGLSATLTALDKGKSVILLEKFPAIGGNTVRTGGWVNAAEPDWQNDFAALPGEKETLMALANTPETEFVGEYLADFKVLKTQLDGYFSALEGGEQYLFDSIELHRIQTYLGGKRTDLNGESIYGQYDLVETLTSRSMESIDWLSTKGIDFDRSVVEIPVGALWRRAHKPKRPKGVEFVDKLQKRIQEQNGQIITDTRATDLIIEDGKVIGIKATEANGNKRVIHVNHGVVLASGGFGANTQMIKKYNTYWKEIADDIKTTNSPALIGDGIEIGEKAGAELVGMGFVQLMPIGNPKSGALLTGLIVPPENFVFVNQQGKRFTDECGSRDVLSDAFFDNGGLIYMIADEKIRQTAANTSDETIEREIKEGIIIQAETLEELATKIGVPQDVLTHTIEQYNGYVAQGHDPEFNKSAFGLKVEQGPFYATPRQPSVHHTMGGLKIDTKARVINKEGEIIPGLYAAGEITGGIHAGNRLGGNALIDIFTYGRIAGESAADLI
ncbi:NADH-dependent flavin oxidoreductase [Vibrio renipiscarius]|uniref:NADH-dependent flavin oxidoreductase n=1 Tax=Vibrio renipiscarius TaxID=1461322 RepID=A0A0C2NJX5_9VIBR|nr:NADH-dependent flavin oxidoreductase [Vibrio renipiscarius]KII76630.1 NADH-dependent flavin oxidoreductase [Vibrio renipiscarius]KII77850.1 NADH-dependent flavin oxidoreductase [Vibrio renipiscarius]